jgi:hypothetical protein
VTLRRRIKTPLPDPTGQSHEIITANNIIYIFANLITSSVLCVSKRIVLIHSNHKSCHSVLEPVAYRHLPLRPFRLFKRTPISPTGSYVSYFNNQTEFWSAPWNMSSTLPSHAYVTGKLKETESESCHHVHCTVWKSLVGWFSIAIWSQVTVGWLGQRSKLLQNVHIELMKATTATENTQFSKYSINKLVYRWDKGLNIQDTTWKVAFALTKNPNV